MPLWQQWSMAVCNIWRLCWWCRCICSLFWLWAVSWATGVWWEIILFVFKHLFNQRSVVILWLLLLHSTSSWTTVSTTASSMVSLQTQEQSITAVKSTRATSFQQFAFSSVTLATGSFTHVLILTLAQGRFSENRKHYRRKSGTNRHE